MGNKDAKEQPRPPQVSSPRATPTNTTPTTPTPQKPTTSTAPIIGRKGSTALPVCPKPPVQKPEPKPAKFEDFEILKVIGRGSYGTVYLVRKIDDRKVYAMKVLKKVDIELRGEVQHTLSEKKVMANVNSPFIAKLHYSFQNEHNLYLVMDFINGGEIYQHLTKETAFDEQRTKFYAASIVCALDTLHSAGIIYRDLKPENVLLKRDGNVVLVDFGQAKLGLNGDDRTTTICGTPAYFAPEIIAGKAYTKAVDWWSLGIMIYEMLWGVGPFYTEDESNLFNNIMEAELILGEDWSPEVNDLLTKLIERDPENRLRDVNSIKKHPWFADIDWKKLMALQLTPPFKPQVSGEMDISEINPELLNETPADSLDSVSDMGFLDAKPTPDAFAGFTYAPTEATEVN